jgi:phospho-N-acetylmuramoyl-pentapeptide-transferase
MNFSFWFLINLLKSQSINVFLLIIFNGIILFLELLNLSQKNNVSYELKSFLPPRHLSKNFTPHVGGIFLISSVLLIFFSLKINHVIKLIILSKSILQTPLDSGLWHLHSEDINFNILSINHYLINIGVIFFIKITTLSLYGKITNKNLLKYSWIWALANIFLLESLLGQGHRFLFPPLDKSIFFNSYNNLIYCYHGILTMIFFLILAYGINKFFNKKENHWLINKYNLRFITMFALGFWLIFNGLLIINKSIYQPVDLGLFSSKSYGYMVAMAAESILIFLFPMIYGAMDDMAKIDEKIFKISDKIKFIILTCVGCLSATQEDNGALLPAIVKIIIPWPMASMITIAAVKSLIFNSVINSINFTDGADGLLYLALMPFLIMSMVIVVFYNYNGFPYARLSFYSLNSMHLFMFMITFIIFFSIFFYFNKKKAKIFLGETGSFGIAAIMFFYIMRTGLDFLFFCGFIMGFFQLLSTTVQRIYYKLTKKKWFLMAPFHHHLELLGYSDQFILILFVLINSIGIGFSSLIYLRCTPGQIIGYVEPIIRKLLFFL